VNLFKFAACWLPEADWCASAAFIQAALKHQADNGNQQAANVTNFAPAVQGDAA